MTAEHAILLLKVITPGIAGFMLMIIYYTAKEAEKNRHGCSLAVCFLALSVVAVMLIAVYSVV